MRFLRLRRLLVEAIESRTPAVVAYEEVARHAGTAASHIYGGIVAVIQEECEARQIPYLGIPVGTVKRKATGKGRCDKADMIAAAGKRWGLTDIQDDNEADALWIAACALEEVGK